VWTRRRLLIAPAVIIDPLYCGTAYATPEFRVARAVASRYLADIAAIEALPQHRRHWLMILPMAERDEWTEEGRAAAAEAAAFEDGKATRRR